MEEKNEQVVEETTQEQVEQKPVEEISTETTPKIDESKFKSAGDDGVIKIDLDQIPTPVENETKEEVVENNEEVVEQEKVEAPQEEVQSETQTLEEITEESVEEVTVEATEKQIEEAVAESESTGQPLPENIQKLMDFMEETGGDLSDYVKLNQDYSKLEDQDLLYEYYKQTKPHLNNEEINFLMEDEFSYDEEADDEREVRKKKIALKEQVANAKSHLDGQKSKYYEDIKAGSKLTSEQQKAIDFFNRYNKQSEEQQVIADKQRSTFTQKTNNVFNDKFKGFEYEVGDKKFRFNVKDVNSTKEAQSDSNIFFKKFLNKNNEIEDAKGFHKALYTAMNSDAIAKHFYEQGKADAMKSSVAKAKNIDMNPRQSHGEVEAGGIKVRVLGDNSSDFKFKIKNKK
tara:strand:+ start:694 stop:1896 length:1203 start_codon:yes stop_codon:yes gene_type:complete